jgi:hypothetical protein
MKPEEHEAYRPPQNPPPGWHKSIEDAVHAAVEGKDAGEYTVTIEVKTGSHVQGWRATV